MDAVLASAYRLAGRPDGMIQRTVTHMREVVKQLKVELEDFATYASPPTDPESMETYDKVIAHSYQVDRSVKTAETMIADLKDAERELGRLLAF